MYFINSVDRTPLTPSWVSVGKPKYYNQTSWTREVISAPEFANQTSLEFAIQFTNSESFLYSEDPAIAIDDFLIEGINDTIHVTTGTTGIQGTTEVITTASTTEATSTTATDTSGTTEGRTTGVEIITVTEGTTGTTAESITTGSTSGIKQSLVKRKLSCQKLQQMNKVPQIHVCHPLSMCSNVHISDYHNGGVGCRCGSCSHSNNISGTVCEKKTKKIITTNHCGTRA
jgi:hypothetical protein